MSNLKYLIQNGFNQNLIRLQNKRKFKDCPMWAKQPISMQIDTTNKSCSLNCEYCNPQNSFIDDENTGTLPMETISYAIEEIRKAGIKLNAFYPFMNSDPLREDRLAEITKLAKKKLKTEILISTNGVMYAKRNLLKDRNINDVCFTISAITAETYNKVHGKPLLESALNTVNWLKENKYWNQRIGVRFVLYDRNVKELESWKKHFSDLDPSIGQEVRVLHSGGDRNKSGKLSATDEIYQEYRKRQIAKFESWRTPCNCFGNLSISFDGKIMQCCDLPYKHNWGHIEEVDLMEVWNKRIDLALDHPGCKNCSQINPNWKELFENYT